MAIDFEALAKRSDELAEGYAAMAAHHEREAEKFRRFAGECKDEAAQARRGFRQASEGGYREPQPGVRV